MVIGSTLCQRGAVAVAPDQLDATAKIQVEIASFDVDAVDGSR